MTTFTPDTILGDIVTADPANARILDRFGIDYCCHGQRSVANACAASSIDANELLNALGTARTAQRPEWADLNDVSLIAHIVSTHHRFLWNEFPRMAELVDKVARVHGANHSELTRVRDAFHELRAAVEPHLRTEETLLFPQISMRSATPHEPLSSELRAELSQNLTEHDRAGELLAELRQITNGFAVPPDACGSYKAMLAGLEEIEKDLHMHVHKENNVLFTRVLASA